MKVIEACEDYAVTKEGKVFSFKWGKVRELTISKSRNGYSRVHLNIDCKDKSAYVHRLVAEAYIPNPHNLPQVNHKDGNKDNNNVSNLEWCTAQYNVQHALNIGLKPSMVGVTNGNAKLSEEQVKEIINLILDGFTNTEIAKCYRLQSSYISLIRSKKRWRCLWDSEFSHVTTVPKSNNKRTRNLNAQRLSKA